MRFNNFDIRTDQYNWILSTVGTVKDEESKNYGKETLSTVGFYNSLESLIEALKGYVLREVWELSDNTKEVAEMLVMELEDVIKIKDEVK
jgi:hypothetical protein